MDRKTLALIEREIYMEGEVEKMRADMEAWRIGVNRELAYAGSRRQISRAWTWVEREQDRQAWADEQEQARDKRQ